MGKNSESRIKLNKDGDTKVLFKKSNPAMFPHSRTISGASQLYSRSGILQIKKNLETDRQTYYTDRGKVKRDLSVETDVCILRRYFRNKKNSLLGTTSGKSKYSTLVDTECETIEEYPDTSGCGDNDTDKSNQPLDIASLMIDNLKDLLNQWIQKHIIQNKETKQKIDTVLDSLIQKLDTRNNLPSTSGSTYILHKEAGKHEVKNKKVATASLTCQYCKHKSRYSNVGSSAAESGVIHKRSEHTAPFHYNDLRIISTLSIPRSFHKKGLKEKKEQNSSWYRMKKNKYKNIVLSIDRSNKLIDSSSFDLVAISTKSFKKSTNNDTIVKKKKRHILFYPKPLYKSTTETSSVTNHENLQINNIDIGKDRLESMPSLLKSLYANEPNMPDKNIQCDAENSNYTMTEINSNKVTTSNAEVFNEVAKDIYVKQIETEEYLPEENESKATVAKDFVDRITNFSNFEISNLTVPKNSPIKIKNSHKKNSNRGKVNKSKKRVAFKSIQHKQFIRKANSQTSQRSEFFEHCQHIMQYFEEHKNKNIKLDVQINVYPKSECKTRDVSTDVSNQTLGIYDIEFNSTLLYNIQSTKLDASVHMDEEPIKLKTENENSSNEFSPEIIPLLDSSVCRAKFIFDENSKEKVETFSKHNRLIEQSTLTTELEIVQEISELREVIRDLASAAERFVNEQLKKESNKSNAETNISRNPSNYTSSSKVEAVINFRNPSKAIQFSKELVEKQKLLSGLKITKEPKRKETFDFYNRLAKKSTSYRIIDSESILRVTDMTSRANELNELPQIRDNPDIRGSRVTRVTDDVVCRSLQKSISLFEITSEQAEKRKVPALFRDQKNLQCRVCSIHRNLSPSSCSEKSCRQLKKLFARAKKKANGNQDGPKLPQCICGSDNNYKSIQFVSMPALDPDPERICTPRHNYSSSVACAPDDAEQKVSIRDLGENEEAAHFCSSLTKSCVSAEDDPVGIRLQKCYKERRGMGFGEGCVYCVLLWIPILLLGCLFYAYVLKDSIKVSLQAVEPDAKVVPRPNLEMKATVQRNGTSFLHLKPSDLGF